MTRRLLPHRFALQRRHDASGVSGTGVVAYGTVYPTGRTTLAWCVGDVASVTVYDSPEQVELVHGHGGATDLVWIDAYDHTRSLTLVRNDYKRPGGDHLLSYSTAVRDRVTPRPWGLTRLCPFLSPPGEWPASMSVEPATQLGVYYGLDGQVMPIQASARGKHGSLDTTYLPTTTVGDGVPGRATDRTDTDAKQDSD